MEHPSTIINFIEWHRGILFMAILPSCQLLRISEQLKLLLLKHFHVSNLKGIQVERLP